MGLLTWLAVCRPLLVFGIVVLPTHQTAHHSLLHHPHCRFIPSMPRPRFPDAHLPEDHQEMGEMASGYRPWQLVKGPIKPLLRAYLLLFGLLFLIFCIDALCIPDSTFHVVQSPVSSKDMHHFRLLRLNPDLLIGRLLGPADVSGGPVNIEIRRSGGSKCRGLSWLKYD